MKFHSGMSPTLVTLWMIGSLLRRVLAVDDLPEQRPLVDADLDALAMAVALARVSRREPLLVDEEALALVHDRVLRRRDDLGGRFDRRVIGLDHHLEEGATRRGPVGFAGLEHRDLAAAHRAQHLAEPQLDLAHRHDHALRAPRRRAFSARRVIAAHEHVVVLERGRRPQRTGGRERREQRHGGQAS